MELDQDTIKLNNIFKPGLMEEIARVVSEDRRFAYYTSADTAIQIIRNGELWFRNATVMNDFSEIRYGIDLIRQVFSGEDGEVFRTAVSNVSTTAISEVDELVSSWATDWEFETYLACISMHADDEDRNGRLSMWRAYGDTALIVNNTPMTSTTDLLGVFSVPVSYIDADGLRAKIAKISSEIEINQVYLKAMDPPAFVMWLREMFFSIAIATKHPGFAEEKEWRLFYRPTEHVSPGMVCKTVLINGVPQKIWALRLANEPENGLMGASIPTLLDRIIIGPTDHAYVSAKAFRQVLADAGVPVENEKVFVSDIPLRTG